MSKRFCLALDLKNDATLIAEYEAYHQNGWPEILKSIKDRVLKNGNLPDRQPAFYDHGNKR